MSKTNKSVSIKEEDIELMGVLVDKIDNLRAALNLPMPAEFHVTQMKQELETLLEEFKEIYFKLGGEDVWD